MVEIHHVDKAEQLFLRLASHEEVARHRKQRHQCEILIDRGNAKIECVFGRGETHRFAVDEVGAFARLVHAGERLDQRGFAGAVVAQQAMHLAAF